MPEYAFADSSFLVARFNVRDRDHRAAIEFLEAQKGASPDAFRLVFSDYVFDETVTALAVRSKRHDLASAAGRAILESKNLRLVRIEPPVFAAAWKLFVRRSVKRWSFTDCTSFVLMENLELRKALAFDRNFVEAGFAMIPELACCSAASLGKSLPQQGGRCCCARDEARRGRRPCEDSSVEPPGDERARQGERKPSRRSLTSREPREAKPTEEQKEPRREEDQELGGNQHRLNGRGQEDRGHDAAPQD